MKFKFYIIHDLQHSLEQDPYYQTHSILYLKMWLTPDRGIFPCMHEIEMKVNNDWD